MLDCRTVLASPVCAPASHSCCLQDLQQQQLALTTLTAEHSSTQEQAAQLQDSAAQLQQQLVQARTHLKDASVENNLEVQALQDELAAGQQELQTLQAAHAQADHTQAQQISQLLAELDSSKAAHAEAVEQRTQMQSQLSMDGQQEAKLDQLRQQHDEALSVLRARLHQSQQDLDAASAAKSSLQEQLAEAAASQQQHSSELEQLNDQIASLTKDLSSRESTPEHVLHGDLQPQLETVRADATKLANKLAQAEMKASLLRQQLQVQLTCHGPWTCMIAYQAHHMYMSNVSHQLSFNVCTVAKMPSSKL